MTETPQITETAEATELRPGTWVIDPAHSEVGFTVRHLMAKVRGHFQIFEGTVTTGASLAETTAQATIDLASVNTNNAQRDAHLRSADFFETEQHGHMTFTATSFDGQTAVGDLTIKGVTRPVELDVEFLGVGGDPWGGTRLGFEATGEINRKDFGIDFNIPVEGGRLMVGDKIALQLNIEAVLQEEQQA